MDLASRFSLAGKVALVIGGSSGIGREIALAFRDAGASVVPVGRTAAKVEEVVGRLRQSDPAAAGHASDVADIAALGRLVDQVTARHGRIDVLVNSQGITKLSPAEEFAEADFDHIIATNLKSVFFACTIVGKHMLAAGAGAIINIASIAAFGGFRRTALYTMSKHGVVGLTETLAIEWATRGVRVNAIAPGFFHSRLADGAIAMNESAIKASSPIPRVGDAGELKGVAVFLASDASNYITGQTIIVDGGRTIA